MHPCICAGETGSVVTARWSCWLLVTLAAVCHLSPGCHALPGTFASDDDPITLIDTPVRVTDVHIGLDDNYIEIRPHTVFKADFEATLRAARSYHDVIRIFYDYPLTDDVIEKMVTSPNGSVVIRRQVAEEGRGGERYLPRMGGVRDYDWETEMNADDTSSAHVFWARLASPAAEARRLDSSSSSSSSSRDASAGDESDSSSRARTAQPPCDKCDVIPTQSKPQPGVSSDLDITSRVGPVTLVSGDSKHGDNTHHRSTSRHRHGADRRSKSHKRGQGKAAKASGRKLPQPQAIANAATAIELATEHYQEMAEAGSCQPQPRIIHLRDMQLAANKAYFPECTTVYRCPRDACCQETGMQCVPHHVTTIIRHFMMLHQSASGDMPVVGLSPAGLDTLALNFTNHTSCHCRPIKPLPTCLPCPHPFHLTRHSETLRCRCVCPDDHKTCHKMRQGVVPLPIDKLRCVKEKRCARPACRYGQFDEVTSYCPLAPPAAVSDIQADSGWTESEYDVDLYEPPSVYRYE